MEWKSCQDFQRFLRIMPVCVILFSQEGGASLHKVQGGEADEYRRSHRITYACHCGYQAGPSRHKLHIAYSDFSSRYALIPLLLLSKSDPLRWAPIWLWHNCKEVAAPDQQQKEAAFSQAINLLED